MTPLRYTSQNSAEPVISRIGRTSTPGVAMSIANIVSPACGRAAAGSVRASSTPICDHCASVVQTFCPSTRKVPSGNGTALVDNRARSLPHSRFAEQLAPDVLRRPDPWQVPGALSLRPELNNQMCRQQHLVDGAGRPRPDDLFHNNRVVIRTVVLATAVYGGPRTAHVSRIEQIGIPAPQCPLGLGVTRNPDSVVAFAGWRFAGDEFLNLLPRASLVAFTFGVVATMKPPVPTAGPPARGRFPVQRFAPPCAGRNGARTPR